MLVKRCILGCVCPGVRFKRVNAIRDFSRSFGVDIVSCRGGVKLHLGSETWRQQNATHTQTASPGAVSA